MSEDIILEAPQDCDDHRPPPEEAKLGTTYRCWACRGHFILHKIMDRRPDGTGTETWVEIPWELS